MRNTMMALAAGALVFAGAAVAQELSQADVKNFVAVAQELKGFESKYPEVVADMKMDDPQSLAAMSAEDGSVDIYSTMIDRLPAGAARSDVTSVVKKHGFSSIDTFASTGDRVIMSFIAAEMEKQDMSQMENITPEMLAMMPPQAREQISLAKKMMDAAKNVPAADVAVVSEMRPQIEAAFQQ